MKEHRKKLREREIHYLSRVLGSQCGGCGELEVGVEVEGVEGSAMVRVSVKGNE